MGYGALLNKLEFRMAYRADATFRGVFAYWGTTLINNLS